MARFSSILNLLMANQMDAFWMHVELKPKLYPEVEFGFCQVMAKYFL